MDCLKQLTQSLLSSWLAHSKTLRLSVLEKLKDKHEWNRAMQFIQTYGTEIFHSALSESRQYPRDSLPRPR